MADADPEGEPAQLGTTADGVEADYDDFEKCGVLGRGGSATVHEVRVGDRRFALKEPHVPGDDAVVRRFRREAETWERLDDHDGVVDVLGWSTDPHPWIALELADGGDLRDRGGHSVGEATRIARTLADAVHHAHRHGVVHLDLKPDNVLFRTDGPDDPAIADWGLARLREDAPDADGVSPPYGAPEQLAPDRFGDPDERTDVYQLGALYYRLLTGESPASDGATPSPEAALDGDPPRPTEVDPALPEAVDDVVARAMATDPADRYASALELRRDLDSLGATLAGADAGDRDGVAVGGATDGPAGDRTGGGSGEGDYGTAAGLERQGFVRLAPHYFDGRDPTPPGRAWRAGLRLVDVRDGAAIDRRVDRDGRQVELAGHLRERLEDGDDLVVVGPPGAGKSTVCKQVACAWHEAGRPVLYRESGTGDRLDAPATLRRHLDRVDGHALVVVEDAVRPEASAVLDAVDAFEDEESVTSLLDARRGEWADAGIHLERERERTRRRALDVVPVPRPGRDEYERFVDAVGRTADADLDVTVDELLPEVRSEAAGEERSPGELFLLLHRLLSYLDVHDDESGIAGDDEVTTGSDGETAGDGDATVHDEGPTTSLDGAVRWTRLDLERRGETALDVGVAANLLNAAGVSVHPELLHAVAPEEDAAVVEAIDALEGRVLFPDADRDRAGPYRAVHEVWSAEFLAHLLDAEGERAAHERVGRVVSRILELADDAELRDHLAWLLRGETDYLVRIADDPGEWADDVVKAVFQLGSEWPKFAPLFGTTGDSAFELPDACSADVRTRIPEWRGDAYRRHADYDRAEREYEQLAEVAESVTSEADSARLRVQSSLGIARVQVKRGEYESAVETAREGLSVADVDSRERCQLLGALASAQLQQGAIERARETTQRQREMADGIGARDIEAEALRRLGKAAREQGAYDEAREYFERALDLRRDLGHRHGEAEGLHELGTVFLSRGEYERAGEYFERSLSLKREFGDRQGEARSLSNLGIVSHGFGEFDRAREYFERSLSIKRQIGDRQGQTSALNNLGLIARKQGRYGEAREYLERSLSIKRDLGARKGEAETHNNLGIVARDLGEYDDARTHYERSLEISREIGSRQGEVDATNNLAIIAKDEGRYEEAQERFEHCLGIMRDLDNREGELNTLANLGIVARERGQYDRASEYFEQGLGIARELGNPNREADTLTDLGLVDCRRGRPEEARDRFERSLAVKRDVGDRQGEARCLGNLGMVAQSEGEYEEAQEYFEQAADLFDDVDDPRGTARVRLRRGRLALDRSETERARRQAREAVGTFEDLGSRHWTGRSRDLLGRVEAASGPPEAAREHWRSAVETFEAVGAPQDALGTLERLVETCREAGEDDRAREWCRHAEETLADAPEAVADRHREWVDSQAEELGID
ncbi:hypothetical protein BRD00_02530 [Halobacteriales archaeon QS_8_69_26]|nr:MAG: hypothetical protein BRD00_02530 [Halobacteriales archaeon QS_8_69_26]